MAVVTGDPSKAATFTIQLSMPAGYKIHAHFDPTEEKVEVTKGTFLVGMGDKFDLTKAKPMKTYRPCPARLERAQRRRVLGRLSLSELGGDHRLLSRRGTGNQCAS